MAKIKCKVCANEAGGICKVKKIGVKINKPRSCEAFILEESKIKAKQDVPTIKFGYVDKLKAKEARKEQMKKLKEEIKKMQEQRATMPVVTPVIKGGASILPVKQNIVIPGNTEHPLTGDLSRFMTTADEEKGE